LASAIIIPKLTDEMQEGLILEWLCSEGDPVSASQILFVVETDKAVVEVPAGQAGTLLKILVPSGSTVPVGSPVAWIGIPGEAILQPPSRAPASEINVRHEERPAAEPSVDVVATDQQEPVLASPIAKRLARELGVDLSAVQAHTGRRRITEADVRAYSGAQVRAAPAALVEQPARARPEVEFTLVHPTPLQRTMAVRMTESAGIPQFASACDVDFTNLERFRNEQLTGWEAAHGFRLTHTHILAALVARALEGHPMLNASWTPEGIRAYRVVNLGIAMATERGLVVPVVRRANQLSLEDVAAEIVRLRQAAERNRLLTADLEGGTFTLTSVGMMGISLSLPLLNPPQSGILAVASTRAQLVLENSELKSIPIATITLVADHRVVDGAANTACLRSIKELFENPAPVLRRK
jgi:pyruvate dehydrogenase E2 component (dihydrolipoamide acetyltransferase)